MDRAQSPSSAIVHSCRNALQLRWCGRASAPTVCAHPSTSCPIGAENPSRSIRTGVGRSIVHSVRPAVWESICLAATILPFSTPDEHRATQTSARVCLHSTGCCTRAASASRMWLVPRLCSCRAADMCSVRIVSVGSAPSTSRRALCRCAAARARHRTRRVGRERCRACVSYWSGTVAADAQMPRYRLQRSDSGGGCGQARRQGDLREVRGR